MCFISAYQLHLLYSVGLSYGYYFLFKIYYIIIIIIWLCWLFVAVHGLSLVAVSGGYSVAAHGLLIAVASLVVEHRLQGVWTSVVVTRGLSSCGLRALEHRLSSCGAWAQLRRGMWDLPAPGIEPVFPALAGGFLTTAPPGKSWILFSYFCKPH